MTRDTYLTSRDRAVFGACPMLMAPTEGELPPLAPGMHRFVAARDGIYVQGRSDTLEVAFRISETPASLPYGPMAPYLRLIHGKVPWDLVAECARRSVAATPKEWAGVILAGESGYELVEPEVHYARVGAVSYNRHSYEDERVVVDAHSHGPIDAYFSATDDECDRQGVYIAIVFGRCNTLDEIKAQARVTVNGWFWTLHQDQWVATE